MMYIYMRYCDSDMYIHSVYKFQRRRAEIFIYMCIRYTYFDVCIYVIFSIVTCNRYVACARVYTCMYVYTHTYPRTQREQERERERERERARERGRANEREREREQVSE